MREALIQLDLQTVVIRTDRVLSLEELRVAEIRCSRHAGDRRRPVRQNEIVDYEIRDSHDLHAGPDVGCELIDLLLCDVSLIDLSEARKFSAGRAYVSDFKKGTCGQLLLINEIVVLCIGCLEF